MTWVNPVRKLIAQLSVDLWMGCHRLGFPAKCILSHTSPTSRYVMVRDGPTIRLSDHIHNNPQYHYDHEILVSAHDNPKDKLLEVTRLLEQIAVGRRAAAA